MRNVVGRTVDEAQQEWFDGLSAHRAADYFNLSHGRSPSSAD
jgi:hypothetical protein